MRNQLPESVIKAHIIQWLRLQKDCFVWVNTSVGVWDEKKKIYRKMNGVGQMRGTADILGIFQRRAVAIEVKSATGRLTTDQALFLTRFKEAGGIALVARSVDDVIRGLSGISKASSV